MTKEVIPKGFSEEEWHSKTDSAKKWWLARLEKGHTRQYLDANRAKGGKNSKGVKKRSGFASNRALASEMGKRRAQEVWGEADNKGKMSE